MSFQTGDEHEQKRRVEESRVEFSEECPFARITVEADEASRDALFCADFSRDPNAQRIKQALDDGILTLRTTTVGRDEQIVEVSLCFRDDRPFARLEFESAEATEERERSERRARYEKALRTQT